MSHGLCIALNGVISELLIPVKTKDVLDWIRKKYKNNTIQFQGKLQDPSKETRMLHIFASTSDEEEDVNSHMLPSPFDEEVYSSPIIVLATENDETDSYIPNASSYAAIRPHEYETLYQEWTFAVDDEEDIVVEPEDVEEDVVEDVVFDDV